MNSEFLCESIKKHNVKLSKETVKEIENFAVKANDPKVAFTLCCCAFNVDVSKMLNVILKSKESCYAVGFLRYYDGELKHKDFLKLKDYLYDNRIYRHHQRFGHVNDYLSAKCERLDGGSIELKEEDIEEMNIEKEKMIRKNQKEESIL